LQLSDCKFPHQISQTTDAIDHPVVDTKEVSAIYLQITAAV
jgi:hypothetical protein